MIDDGTGQLKNKANADKNYAKLVRLARLPRLYKLLRIMRLFKMIRLLKYNRNIKKLMDKLKMNPAYVRMITLTLTVCFLVHLISCFYFMVVSFSDFEPGCWIVTRGLMDEDNFTQYISAMYWAFQTLTTVGYGDMQGTTLEERLFSIMWILFGVAFYSFTIGNLQTMLS
jgi:CRP-like cAMP-binding protein